MKKRTKISLRTKIYLTILGLLTLSGIIYAANPVTFSVFPGLTGIAVSKSELFTTGFADPNSGIYTLNCAGIPTLYQASAPAEKYFAIAPAQAGPPNNTFTPRDIVKDMASRIPGAVYRELVGASHAAPTEQPQQINEYIDTFLAKLD